jgi:Ca-activated chloride channel homolog
MSFASPVALAALALIPLAVAWHVTRQRRASRYAVRFTGTDTLAGLLPQPAAWRRLLPPALFLAALAALLIAVARPQATVAVPVERATVVLVTDASRSMLAEDVDPSRIDAVKRAANSFIDQVPDELRVGSVAFAEVPHSLEPPTTDHDAIRDAIDAIEADGGTGTGDALVAALRMARGNSDDEENRPPAAIVLLSDGKATRGRDPVGVAREARRAGVPIYTVALGTEEGVVPGPSLGGLPVPPDPETMRQIARVSGGRAFVVEDAERLDSIYEDLGSRVGTKSEKRELTGAFAGGGLALLLAATAFGLRFSGRLP